MERAVIEKLPISGQPTAVLIILFYKTPRYVLGYLPVSVLGYKEAVGISKKQSLE